MRMMRRRRIVDYYIDQGKANNKKRYGTMMNDGSVPMVNDHDGSAVVLNHHHDVTVMNNHHSYSNSTT